MPSFNMQAAYATQFAKGVPGQIANEEKYNAVSRSVETAAGLGFGQPAYRGVDDHGCIVYAASAKFVGIAVKTIAPEAGPNGGTPIVDGYPQRATAGLMTEGQMYVMAGATVADGDAVYWSTTTKRYTNVNTDIAIPGAFFDTSGVNGGIVEISLAHRVA